MPSSYVTPVLRLVAILAVAASVSAGALAQSNQPPARFSAVAMDLERGGAVQLQIVVNRWTNMAERDRLMKILLDDGADALLEALRRVPKVGYIQTPGEIGWSLYYAEQARGEDGRERIMLITDRQLSFSEAAGRQRSADYPFTVVEMQLKNGEGEGTLSLATKIIPDRENSLVVLENFDIQRIRLTQVKRTSQTR
jgi:hypothetical protein